MLTSPRIFADARRLSAILMLFAVIWADPGAAQTAAGIELADPADVPLVVSGAIQKGQSIPTFSGNVLLKPSGAARVDLRMRSSHLILDEDPRIFINRADVAIPSSTALEAGQEGMCASALRTCPVPAGTGEH
jgi:hypothetical protein